MANTTVQAEFDLEKAEAFGNRLLTVLNDGALCLMTSIGHRAGLFDALSGLPPATSDEIARKARLQERYVREWLGAMVAARVVEVDPATGHYRLPREHAGFLTRPAGPDNMATYAQFVGLLGVVEDAVLACFERGGGVPYARYPRFHSVMAEDSAQSVLGALESDVLPLVSGLSNRLTRGITVLDLGCGSGRVLNHLAARYPRSTFRGIDLSDEAIGAARREASERRLENVDFILADLTDFDVTARSEAYDVVTTFDAIHDQAQPLNVLRGIHRALRDDGVYLMQDINGSSLVHENVSHPMGTFLYTVSCMHCMTVSLAQDGEGLGAMWGEQKTLEYLSRAGFSKVETHRLPHDLLNNWYVIRK